VSRKHGQTMHAGGNTAEIPRILLHPDGGGGWLETGDPLDAGAMHHLSQDASHLAWQSARHLASDIGPGKLPVNGTTYTGDGWDGAYSDTPDAASTASEPIHYAIAWDYKTARSYHLPNLIADRDLPGGGIGLRIICVELDVYVDSANSLKLYAALTPSYATPDRGTLAVATYSAWSASGEHFSGNEASPSYLPTGRQIVRLWLIAKTPAGAPWAQWRCRGSGSIAAVQSLVLEGHLWVGWRSSDVDNEIITINAWEMPEPYRPLFDESVSSNIKQWHRADLSTITDPTATPETVYNVKNNVDGRAAYDLENGAPILNRNGINGRPVLQFLGDAAHDMQTVFSTTAFSTVTMFVVMKVVTQNTTGITQVYSTVAFPSSGSPDGGFGIIANGANWGFWAENRTTGFVGTTLTVDRPYILTGRGNATDVFFDVNGIEVATAGRLGSAGATALQFQVGHTATYNGDGRFELAEVLVYEADLSLAERTLVLEYLNRHYEVF